MPQPDPLVWSDERQSLLQTSYAESVSVGDDTDTSSIITVEQAKSIVHSLSTIFIEVVVRANACVPLIFAYLLQYSVTLVTIIVAGHLGPLDLAATSLAIMTSNVTGISLYEGLAAGLDTLCAQAYDIGRPSMVGVHVQHMSHLMLLFTFPIALMWAFSSHWLVLIISDRTLAHRAGKVMAILAIGNPGYALFTSGRRFAQAQGLFRAPLYVMVLALPTSVFLNWLFTYKLGMGLIGAALALAITRILFPVYLFAYMLVVKPCSLKCWGGWESLRPSVWSHMVWLSVPGVCIAEAEVLIFQFLIMAATYLSIDAAAAQSIVTTIAVALGQIPLATGIVVATRLGQFVGSKAFRQAKLTMKTSIVLSLCLGGLNGALLYILKEPILELFSKDEHVKQLVRKVLPIMVAFQVPQYAVGVINGMLRGIAMPGYGACINFLLFVTIGVPAGLNLCFGSPQMKLLGLWLGVLISYLLVTIACVVYGLNTDLRKVAAKIMDVD